MSTNVNSASLRLRGLGLAVAVASLAAAGPLAGSMAAQADRRPPAETLDDLLAAVGRQVPAFGGMVLAPDETTLVVDLTEVNRTTTRAAARAIAAVFGADLVSRGVRFRRSRYSFAQLREWYERMAEPILSMGGVSFTDIDEANNRLRIGSIRGAVARVGEQLDLLYIPREAVAIEVTAPVVPLSHTLNHSISPRQGGYAATRLATSGIATATIGFNAIRAGVPGFVTNSHNTAVSFMPDTQAGHPAADFYQASSYVPSQWVGTESVDPPGFPCAPPHPSAYNCRYSDSVFIKYNSNVAWAQGIIARTTAPTLWDGLSPCFPANPQCVLTVNHSLGNNVGPGRFGITHPPTLPYLHGLKLQKVGRTTGWTSGSIEGTCVDYVRQANGITVLVTTVLLCQYQVGNQFDANASNDWWRIATFGDSGSPAFRIRHAGWKHVELYGIVWGGNTFNNSFGAKKFVFSPLRGIMADLGSFDYAGQCLPPNPTC